eukprot:TRINITY_DN5360_c0_g2_i1.p1 TRINITY_DN5360_c0_g2~~TRINITY_DN5360_c0_g2_i1.p1  ORF type:complete len:733 (+),score=73.64 TRINITY_DN5360_c0_g2_i1:233-2200(+)
MDVLIFRQDGPVSRIMSLLSIWANHFGAAAVGPSNWLMNSFFRALDDPSDKYRPLVTVRMLEFVSQFDAVALARVAQLASLSLEYIPLLEAEWGEPRTSAFRSYCCRKLGWPQAARGSLVDSLSSYRAAQDPLALLKISELIDSVPKEDLLAVNSQGMTLLDLAFAQGSALQLCSDSFEKALSAKSELEPDDLKLMQRIVDAALVAGCRLTSRRNLLMLASLVECRPAILRKARGVGRGKATEALLYHLSHISLTHETVDVVEWLELIWEESLLSTLTADGFSPGPGQSLIRYFAHHQDIFFPWLEERLRKNWETKHLEPSSIGGPSINAAEAFFSNLFLLDWTPFVAEDPLAPGIKSFWIRLCTLEHPSHLPRHYIRIHPRFHPVIIQEESRRNPVHLHHISATFDSSPDEIRWEYMQHRFEMRILLCSQSIEFASVLFQRKGAPWAERMKSTLAVGGFFSPVLNQVPVISSYMKDDTVEHYRHLVACIPRDVLEETAGAVPRSLLRRVSSLQAQTSPHDSSKKTVPSTGSNPRKTPSSPKTLPDVASPERSEEISSATHGSVQAQSIFSGFSFSTNPFSIPSSSSACATLGLNPFAVPLSASSSTSNPFSSLGSPPSPSAPFMAPDRIEEVPSAFSLNTSAEPVSKDSPFSEL